MSEIGFPSRNNTALGPLHLIRTHPAAHPFLTHLHASHLAHPVYLTRSINALHGVCVLCSNV